jgi:hypothetical protein
MGPSNRWDSLSRLLPVNIKRDSPLTASAQSLLHENYCRRHGESAFRCRSSRPPTDLSLLDDRIHLLRVNAIEKSTRKGYTIGARDYIDFGSKRSLPLDPTPQTLYLYIAYTSQFIASAPKYLTGTRHFRIGLLNELNKINGLTVRSLAAGRSSGSFAFAYAQSRSFVRVRRCSWCGIK